MTNLILASGWLAAVLLAVRGWGAIVRRTLSPSERPSWGEQSTWGVALLVAIGGALNWARSISAPLLRWLVTIGCAACLVDWLLMRRKAEVSRRTPSEWRAWRSPVTIVGLSAVAALAGLQVAGSLSGFANPRRVSAASFNPADDYQAYFVFPAKMLSAGAMGPDPYSYRRLSSSLGGESFLDAITLSVLRPQNLHLMDPGLGVVLLFALLCGVLRRHGASPLVTIGTLGLFVALPPPTVNITSITTGAAMILALALAARFLDSSAGVSWRRAALFALIAAAGCALKSSLIAPSTALLAMIYIWAIVRGDDWKARCAEFWMSAVFTALLLLPWMLALRESLGTLLYPLLGRGFEDHLPPPASFLTRRQVIGVMARSVLSPSSLALLTLAASVAIRGRWKQGAFGPVICLGAAALASSPIVAVAIGGFDTDRFSYAFVLPGILLAIGVLLSTRIDGVRRRLSTLFVGVVALCVFSLTRSSSGDTLRRYADAIVALHHAMSERGIATNDEINRARRMQAVIPAGAVVLTRLEKPWLLDFARNTVFILDWPGAAAPVRGMPSSEGGEALGRYLLVQRLRYVAYSYAHEAAFGRSALARRLLEDMHPWSRTSAQLAFDVQDELSALGTTRRRVFDDGDTFVIDLTQPASPSRQ